MANPKNIINDKWLSAMLRKKTYKILFDRAFMQKLQLKNGLDTLRKLMSKNRPAFFYTKIPAAFTAGARVLEKLGFHLVDTNVVFEKALSSSPNNLEYPCDIRFADAEDEDGVVKVAGRSFVYSRFHLDSAIPPQTANKIKAEWAKNFFSGGRGEAMVVAYEEDKVIGFLQLLKDKNGVLTIDQIAVDVVYQRRGIARAMILYAEGNCKGGKLIRAGTQVSNIPAMRLYENLGFRIAEASYVFHRHCS